MLLNVRTSDFCTSTLFTISERFHVNSMVGMLFVKPCVCKILQTELVVGLLAFLASGNRIGKDSDKFYIHRYLCTRRQHKLITFFSMQIPLLVSHYATRYLMSLHASGCIELISMRLGRVDWDPRQHCWTRIVNDRARSRKVYLKLCSTSLHICWLVKWIFQNSWKSPVRLILTPVFYKQASTSQEIWRNTIIWHKATKTRMRIKLL